VLSDRNSQDDRDGIFLLSPDTGEKRQLTKVPQGLTGDFFPALSPDGRALAFVRWIGPGASDLYVMSLSNELVPQGEPKQLTSDIGVVTRPTWTSDRQEIVFSYLGGERGSTIARLQAAKASRQTAKPQRIAAFGEGSYSPAISHVGHRLVYVSESENSDIWRMELSAAEDSESRVKLRSPPAEALGELIASTRNDWAAAYSPDGKKIAFSSERSGRDEIWIADSDGRNPFQLTDFVGEATGTAHWSPDSRYIAFDARVPGSRGDLFVIDIEEKKPKRLTNDPGDELEPTWSRDGRWIYFASERTGKWQVWKIPSNGGVAAQFTKNGGFFSLESLDRKYLYYGKSFPSGGIWRIPIEGGAETEVVSSLSDWCNFGVTEQGIYFSPATRRSIEFLSFRSGKIKTVFTNAGLGIGLDISPDGRYLLYTQEKAGGSDLMLVENFR